MQDRRPETAEGQRLRAQVSEQRWVRIVAEAEARVAVYQAVQAHHAASGISWRKAVAAAKPDVPWPTFVRYKRRYEGGTGEPWERLLDGRVPPDRSIAEQVRADARSLRRVDCSIGPAAARQHLVAQYGVEGDVSDTWLKRVWSEAGLRRERGAVVVGEPVDEDEDEDVEVFHGGGGLALIAAADAELGLMMKLATRVLEVGEQRTMAQEVAGSGGELGDDTAGRDDHGRFTAEYNARHRESAVEGEADSRWSADEAKAAVKKLSTMANLSIRPETLAAKLMAMGVSPLLTERRGFDGLDGPSGEWLGVLGGVAYMPATLDKALAELGLLGVGNAMWQVHARMWSEVSQRWSEPGPGWLRTVLYVDGTADPYWTRAFAQSGKVSRVGRVMPCISRVALHSSAGVPLLVETHAGAVSLRARLLPMLNRLDEAIGPQAGAERLTVIDAEGGTAGTIVALHDQTNVTVITVIKGQVLAGARVHDEGPWQDYRERDQIREVEVDLNGKGAPEGGITVRGVQMHRTGGRRPQTTLFVTNGHPDTLSAEQVVTRYLNRWPLQEQAFRTARDGGGLDHSHGYGGTYVTHAVLEDKLEQAKSSVAHAKHRHALAREARDHLGKALGSHAASIRNPALALADKAVRDTQKQAERNESAQAKLETMPDRIFVRDTGRENIMACLKLSTLALVEYVLQEYFGGVDMQWRTFIEHLVALPVTVRVREDCRVYQLHANRRKPELMARLAKALDEVNRRAIHRNDELMVFELIGLPQAGS